MEGTCKEQAARRIAIQALEAVLSGQVSPNKTEGWNKELNSLRAVYRAQWDELEDAVGLEACGDVWMQESERVSAKQASSVYRWEPSRDGK